MIRTFVRIDNFDPGASGQRLRRFINPYAVVWGAYPHLNLTFVAPLVILRTQSPANLGRTSTTTSFADGAI